MPKLVQFGEFLKNLKFAVKQCFECDILSLNFLFLVMTHVPLGLKKKAGQKLLTNIVFLAAS